MVLEAPSSLPLSSRSSSKDGVARGLLRYFLVFSSHLDRWIVLADELPL